MHISVRRDRGPVGMGGGLNASYFLSTSIVSRGRAAAPDDYDQ